MSGEKRVRGCAAGATMKKCEGCGREFECGAPSLSCWCAEVRVTAEARAEMAGRFGDCLCPECLVGYAGKATKRT